MDAFRSTLSALTIPEGLGVILRRLKDRGVLVEPVRGRREHAGRARRRAYATRKPKAYTVRRPGDLVEIDTLEIRPVPGGLVKHRPVIGQ